MENRTAQATAGEDRREKARDGAMQVYDVMKFLGKVLRPFNVGGEPPYEQEELEGLGNIMEWCGDKIWPAVEMLGHQGEEVRRG